MSPEQTAGAEFASPDELQQVFTAMNNWLVLHGTKIETTAITAIDPVTGLTIYTGRKDQQTYDSESYEYEMPGAQWQQAAPQGAEVLQIDSDVLFWYTPAHFDFDRSTDQLQYMEPVCGVLYSMPESSLYAEQSLVISLKGDIESPEVVGERHNYAPRRGNMDVRGRDSLEESMRNWVVNSLLEHELGADRITRAECAALAELVSVLENL